MKKKILISECCAAAPSGPVFQSKDRDGNIVRMGFCSNCSEGTTFVYETEYPDELPNNNGPEVNKKE